MATQRNGVLDRRYTFEYDVGLWTFGSVQVLKDRKSGDLKTCKTVPKHLCRNPREAFGRLQRLADVKQKHICSVTDVLEDTSNLYIIADKPAGGDVAEWMVRVQEDGNWLQEHTVVEYVRQTLVAIAHGHSHGANHRDLRPCNLSLSSKMPDAQIVVMDLGLAPILDPEDYTLQKNPCEYTAPEILTGQGRIVPTAPDLWSIGAIAHCLLVGYPPSREQSPWSVTSSLLSRRQDQEWAERSQLSRDFVQRLLLPAGDRPTAATALQHPWLKSAMPLDSSTWNLGTSAAREVQHKMLCYMLAVLLLPEAMQYRDFYQLRQAFARLDTDNDGFVARSLVQKLIKDNGATSEAANLALDVADVRDMAMLDLCTAACADLIAREFMGAGRLNAVDLAPLMMKKFFYTYGDAQQLVASVGSVRSKLCTATMRDIESHADVRYDDILSAFPESGEIDSQSLASELTENCGHGTPLAVPDNIEETDGSSWVGALQMDGIGDFVTGVFQTCGLGHDKLRGYRSIIASQ